MRIYAAIINTLILIALIWLVAERVGAVVYEKDTIYQEEQAAKFCAFWGVANYAIIEDDVFCVIEIELQANGLTYYVPALHTKEQMEQLSGKKYK